MTHHLLLSATFAALALAACGDDAGTEPTQDTVLSPDAGPTADLAVTVAGGEFDDLSYTIVCGPDVEVVEPEVEGVEAAAACDRLADPAAVDRLRTGPPEDQICAEVYGGPQVATITGTLDGQPVEATIDRVDACGISTWEDLLGPVLPPTEGATAVEG